MRTYIIGIVLVTASILSLQAMAVEELSSEEPVIETVDALNRTVLLQEAPRRVVTAGRAVLMIADAVYTFPDASEQLVGVGRINQGRGNFLRAIDDTYETKTIFERNVGPEQIAALRPDLVILKTFMRENLGMGLEEIGIPVIYVELETPEQYARDFITLGRALGNEERAIEILGGFDERRERVTSTTTSVAERDRPSVLFLYIQPGDSGTSFNVPATTWIQTELVRLAGGNPVWTEDVPGGGWNRVNLEQVLRWDPDVVFAVSYNNDIETVLTDLSSNPVVGQLSAFTGHRVYAVPVDFYSWDQPDVRWILGLQWMALRLHPDLFPDLDIREEVYSFYSDLYGMTREETERIIMPLLPVLR